MDFVQAWKILLRQKATEDEFRRYFGEHYEQAKEEYARATARRFSIRRHEGQEPIETSHRLLRVPAVKASRSKYAPHVGAKQRKTKDQS